MTHPTPAAHARAMRSLHTAHGMAGIARLSILTLLVSGSAALAQPAGLPGFELERLELNPDGQGSLVLGSGLLLPEGSLRLSLAGHYEKDPLVMYRNGERLGSVVGTRVMAHVLAAWSPLRWLELGAQLPVIAYQKGDDLSAQGVGAPASPGLSTPMVHVRLGLLSQKREAPLDLALEVGAGLPLGSASTLSRDSVVRLIPRLMLGRSFGLLRAGVMAGALLRPKQVLGIGEDTVQDEVGNELRLGAVLATQGTGLRAELNALGNVPLQARNGRSLELLAGLRLPLTETLEAYALGGPGFGQTPGTPTFRVLLGLAVVTGGKLDVGPLDTDKDGIIDEKDKCPLEPGPVVRQGCPVKDTDKDGIIDEEDKCPTEPGPVARQGCPVKDTDKDGIIDEQDKCPTEPGPAARQGCPVKDTDKDGIIDEEDKCPTEPGTADRQGCPVRDTDKDGIIDEQDKCPTEPGLAELRGCPAKDTDEDGVADHLDNCPSEKGVADNQGCPVQQKQLVAIQKGKLEIKEQVFFATGKAIIQPRSFKMLDQVSRILNDHTEVDQMVIEGHTDDRGKPEANRTLSLARAEAVKSYLVSKGVDAKRLDAKGYGPDRPIESNKTDKGRAANRRVEFIIVTPERELK